MKTLECIAQRRSVRRFTDQEVSNEQLKELMQAARYAPSWANTQCWEFIIVLGLRTSPCDSDSGVRLAWRWPALHVPRRPKRCSAR